MSKPIVLVFAGPNGFGKTTLTDLEAVQKAKENGYEVQYSTG